MGCQEIENILEQANESDIREGKEAFQNYQNLVRSIAIYYDMPFVQMVAAFVSLSPNNAYYQNVRSLVSLVIGVKEKTSVDQIITSTYGHCLRRAYQYLTGEKDFLMETQGPKIKAIYWNILKPADPKHICIDGHAHNAWAGKIRTMKNALIPNVKAYNEIANDYKKVAKNHKLIPNQVQAIVWFTWKRINNILYDRQCNLFAEPDDLWGLKLDPASIPPFTKGEAKQNVEIYQRDHVENFSLFE